MSFNSFEFLIFFPLVFAVYFLCSHRHQWLLLLIASYYFYATWSPQYVTWLVISTLLAYILALLIAQASCEGWRKRLLALSIVSNLGMLFGFKYFNFFNDSLKALFNQFNLFYNAPAFKVLLPVGISFYTFQTISYTIDVYRGEIAPEKHLGIFALYVSFFPQLVAGPIERAGHLLPQFRRQHTFDAPRVFSGLRLILWGMFKKVVVADRLAVYVNAVYNNPLDYYGWTVVLATFFCAVQIYCDFSGYSDIAVGASRVLGHDLTENFRQPYCASSVSEFWRRWHISLSSWFRDYLYIPLGGNRVPRWRWYANLLIVFLVSGLWHGANWTFVLWGALHGLYVVVEVWSKKARDKVAQAFHLEQSAVRTIVGTVVTFSLVSFGWIFFQAKSVSYALLLVRNLVQFNVQSDIYAPWGGITDNLGLEMTLSWGLVVLLTFVHFVHDQRLRLPSFMVKKAWVRWAAYLLLALAIINLGAAKETPFLYTTF